jgi:hypothetical protein
MESKGTEMSFLLSQHLTSCRVGFILAALLLVSLPVQAQPSGGPYGPVRQTYDIPKADHVYYVAPDGNADAPGTTLDAPTTLESAISRVVTGDAIVLRGGTYRTGNLMLNQGITMQPYADEQPVLKGTRVATEWEALRNNVWCTSWKTLFPAKPLGWWRGHRRTPLHRFNNDMVFIDSKMLKSAGSEDELDPNSYFIDYEKGHVFIGVDPANRLVEITAFDGAIVRTAKPVHGKTNDRKGPVIRGITFTQYARRAIEIEGKRSFGPNDEPTDEPIGLSDPATYGKEVTGTTLDNVTITFCSRVAGWFRGDGLTIRRSLFSDTSTEGVYVIGSSDVLLERNIFGRNNIENISGYFPSAVKIFNQSHRVTCRDNLVIDNPNSNGIWYDVGNQDAVFINNWAQDCLIGFFFEICSGAICAGNVFVDCGNGIRVLNSSNVRCWHNTLVNSPASFERTGRSAAADHFGWHASTGPDVDERDGHVFVGNILAADTGFNRPLLRFSQRRNMCDRLTKPQVTQFDGNVYIHAGATGESTLLVWSPVAGDNCIVQLKTLADLHKLHPQFEAHGRVLNLDLGSVFKDPKLGSYELIRDLRPASDVPLPVEIQELLGTSGKKKLLPGAYPFLP